MSCGNCCSSLVVVIVKQVIVASPQSLTMQFHFM